MEAAQAASSGEGHRDDAPKPPAWLHWYDRVLNLIDQVSACVIVLAMGVLTAVITAQVFWRYALNSSIDWSWDVPRLCFIWATLLAIPLAFKRHAHVGIDLLLNLMPRPRRRQVIRFNLIVMIAMMIMVTYYARILAEGVWGNYLNTIPVSVGTFYVALIISSVHTILHMARQVIDPPEFIFAEDGAQ